MIDGVIRAGLGEDVMGAVEEVAEKIRVDTYWIYLIGSNHVFAEGIELSDSEKRSLSERLPREGER